MFERRLYECHGDWHERRLRCRFLGRLSSPLSNAGRCLASEKRSSGKSRGWSWWVVCCYGDLSGWGALDPICPTSLTGAVGLSAGLALPAFDRDSRYFDGMIIFCRIEQTVENSISTYRHKQRMFLQQWPCCLLSSPRSSTNRHMKEKRKEHVVETQSMTE